MLQELVKEMNKCKAFSSALILKSISITFHVVNNDISYIFFCWCDNNSVLAATKLRTNIKCLHSDITPSQLNKCIDNISQKALRFKKLLCELQNPAISMASETA